MAQNDIVMNLVINSLGAVGALSDLKFGLQAVGDVMSDIYDIARDGADVIGGDTVAAYEKFDQVLKETTDSGKALVAEVILPIIQWFNYQADATNIATDALALGLITTEQYNIATGNTNLSLEIQARALADAKVKLDAFNDSLGHEEERLIATAALVGANNKELDALEQTLVSAAIETEQMADAMEGWNEVSEDTVGLIEAVELATRNLGDTNESIVSKIESTIEALKDYASPEMLLALQVLKDLQAAWEGGTLATASFLDFAEQLQAAIEEGNPVAQTGAAAYAGLGESIALANGPAGDMRDIVDDINAGLDAVSGTYSATIDITVTGDPIPDLTAVFGGGAASQKANVGEINKALGGPVSAGVPYTVGEFGPEQFVPNQDGTIIPTQNVNVAPPQVIVMLDGEQIAANVLTQAGSAARQTASAGGAYTGL